MNKKSVFHLTITLIATLAIVFSALPVAAAETFEGIQPLAITLPATDPGLDANEAMVDNFTDLQTVLTNAAYNNVSIIYLNANIIFGATTFTANASRVDFTIVGHPKNNPGVRYTIQDRPGYYVYVGKNGRHVTLRDMDIRGYNYYGPICIDGYTGVTMEFINVNYVGSQTAYNLHGTTIYDNTNIVIGTIPADPVNFPSPPTQNTLNEVAESARLEFGGVCTFIKSDVNTSMFWMTAAEEKYITVRPGAQVTITNDSQSGAYGEAFYIDNSASYAPPLTIGEGASLTFNVRNGVTNNSAMRFDSVTVDKGASLVINHTGDPAADPTLSINKNLTVNQGATLQVTRASNTRTNPLIYFYTTGATCVFNSPKLVQLFNPSGHLIGALTGTISVTGHAGAVKVWTTASLPGSLSSAPSNWWHKNDGSDITFSATLNTTATTAASLGNFDSGNDFATAAFSPSTFNPYVMQLLVLEPFIPQSPGELSFLSVPAQLLFRTITLPGITTLVERVDEAWAILIGDSRAAKGSWRLDASASAPLTATVGKTVYTLPNALVFVDSGGNMTGLDENPLTIFSGATDESGETGIQWDTDKGLLLQINPGEAMPGVEYSTTIRWTLTDAP